MSRLPWPGDAVRTTGLLNKRMGAETGIDTPGEYAWTGPLTIGPEGISGAGVASLRRVYGDLLLVEEVLDDAGWFALCQQHVEQVEGGGDSLSSYVAITLQAMGFGVLMERLRWERGS